MNTEPQAASNSHRIKDWLLFANFVFSVGTPEKVRVRDHMLPYAGQPMRGYFWGVYGTSSINHMLYETAAKASREVQGDENFRAYQINTWYEIKNVGDMPPQHTQESGESFGFLHLGRLRAAYRKQVIESWMEQLREQLGVREANRHVNERIEDLAIQYPQLALGMLSDKVHVVAHPVRDNFQASYTTPIWVLTGREPSDGTTDPRIKASVVRYAADIQVTF